MEDWSINQIKNKLENASSSTRVENPETGDTVLLKTTVEEVKKYDERRVIRGVLKFDYGDEIKQRDGRIRYLIRTQEIPFFFLLGSVYFVPIISGNTANVAAQKISSMIFNQADDPIVSCNITAPNIEDFLNRNPNIITKCWWRNVRIPNLSNANLGGSEINQTSDFQRFDRHADKGSIMLTLQENGWSILINQHASVVFYSKVSRDEMEDFIRREIIPRCH